ncbi:LytTR family transcriptional regulator [Spirosoma sp. BT702]|uniref:LytTR family transcriptional regulator n=1 Tax=Spirosoma profusum TaxID=2771354 RepID=A0A926Y0T1_9BACT|nr:LytTR family DNA-binding domain-containing protein [Spirosoma profusum]MBD2701418.1 LytTR family transcriptional regulator [Spirosoma profusum]
MESIHLIGHPNPVLISSIVWLEGEANYTRVHYQSGGFSIVTQSLHWFEQHLNFVRIHRSAIINPIYVQEFVQKRGRSGWVRLVDDRVMPVSRNRLEHTASRLIQETNFLTS